MPGKKPDILIGTKGLEKGTNFTMSKIVLDEAPDLIDNLAVMSGPNLAREMALHKQTGTVFASYNEATAKRLQALFSTYYFKVFREEDVIGVEAGGALKNIMAFGAGIGTVVGMSQNSGAFYMTRALAEMTRLGMLLGAEREMTFMGLSGIGDLYVSCVGEGGRNKKAGMAFARGELANFLSSGILVESLFTVRAAVALVREHGEEAPITEAINGVLYEGLSIRQGIRQLLDRQPAKEFNGISNLRFQAGRLLMRLLHRIRINSGVTHL